MEKEFIQKYVDKLKLRGEVKKITRVELIPNGFKIYYLITREYAAKYNLDFTARIFEYNLTIPNLSNTREYVDTNYVYGIDLTK